jgi:hypothetical protein
MPARSVRITLSNNTPFPLTRVGNGVLCHGKWTDGGWSPPQQIPLRSSGQWQSESDGFLTGTQGWIKYILGNTDTEQKTGDKCLPEEIFVYWDNPFVWDTKWQLKDRISFQVSTSDVTGPCSADKAIWTGGSNGISSPNCRHEMFLSGASLPQDTGLDDPFNLLFNWPMLLGLTWTSHFDSHSDGGGGLPLEFTIGLRLLGSVEETIFSVYDGSKGLRALTVLGKQPSLRTLLNL